MGCATLFQKSRDRLPRRSRAKAGEGAAGAYAEIIRGNDLSGTLQGAGGIGGLLARSDRMKIVPGILSPLNPDPQYVNTAYYHSDGNGDVTELMQPTGLPVAMYQYDPYGNILAIGGLLANVNKYRFSSKEWNDNTGLYYYGRRFYSPNLQRWINRDPIQEMGGINLFQYAFNNPLTLFDPIGLCPAAGTGLEGQMAETNPGGVNAPPALRITGTSNGKATSENNDNPELIAAAIGASAITAGVALAALVGPEVAAASGPTAADIYEGVPIGIGIGYVLYEQVTGELNEDAEDPGGSCPQPTQKFQPQWP